MQFLTNIKSLVFFISARDFFFFLVSHLAQHLNVRHLAVRSSPADEGAALNCLLFCLSLSPLPPSLHSMWGADKQKADMVNCISNFAANLR